MNWFNKVKEEADSLAEQTEKAVIDTAKEAGEAVVSGAQYVGEGIKDGVQYVGEGIKDTAMIGAYYLEKDAEVVVQGAKALGETISSVIPESVIATAETVVTDAAILGSGAVAIAAIPEEAVVGAVGLAGAEVSDVVLGTEFAPTVINAGIKASKYVGNVAIGAVAGVFATQELSGDSKEVADLKTKLDDKQKQLDDKQKQIEELKVSSQKRLDDKERLIESKQETINALQSSQKQPVVTEKGMTEQQIIEAQQKEIESLKKENQLLKEKPLEKRASEVTQPNKTTEPKQEAPKTEKPLTPKELMVHMTYHRDELHKTDDDKKQDYHLAQMENICAQIAELTGHTPMKGTEPELIAQVEPSQNQNQGMSR